MGRGRDVKVGEIQYLWSSSLWCECEAFVSNSQEGLGATVYGRGYKERTYQRTYGFLPVQIIIVPTEQLQTMQNNQKQVRACVFLKKNLLFLSCKRFLTSDGKFKHFPAVPCKHLFIYANIYSRFSINSAARTSELLDNLEEIYLQYYMQCNVSKMFKSTHCCA